jgi:peptidylprolyl isomerase
MKISLSALILTVSSLPLAAQTTAAKPPVHHTATAATHHAVAKSVCPIELPTLSPKIPALPATAPKCPAVNYQLTYIDTKIGTGELAAPKKWYTVHYTGYLLDGTKFDSSLDRGGPITFPYGAHRVITGWDTGFDGMHVGGKRRLFVPYQLAYGEAGRPPVIPEKAELIFDVELVSQSDTPPAPKTPPAPTAGAAKPAAPSSGTPSGTPPATTTTPSAAPAPKPATPAQQPATTTPPKQ